MKDANLARHVLQGHTEDTTLESKPISSGLKYCVYINAAILVSMTLYLFLIPALWLTYDLNDPGLSSAQTPRFAFRWHLSLTPKYERWAKERLAAGPVPSLHDLGVSGTEWPLFGSVFYLWATDDLQQAVDKDPSLSRRPPRDYARDAIKAATALVVDPGQATWVKDYWGDDYLDKDNLFYRMLLISAMTSYERLIHDGQYLEALRSHTESLAAELNASPHGLLDDYPDYCYPVDIVAAIAAIKRADTVLGTDHDAFVRRALRGFQGTRLHSDTDLPGYQANKHTGQAQDAARGIGLSFMLIWAADLWPDTAQTWYQKYEQHFWQEGFWCAGFREYPRDIKVPWFQINDPDAGPVFAGYGTAACAFGIPAARALGRYDHLKSLSSQALVTVWPLAHGTLLIPRVLSNLSEAPYLGEAATLFTFVHQPQHTPAVTTRAQSMPGSVVVGLCLMALLGLSGPIAAVSTIKRWHRDSSQCHVHAPSLQSVIWSLLLILACVTWFLCNPMVGLVFVLAAQLVPRTACKRSKEAKNT